MPDPSDPDAPGAGQPPAPRSHPNDPLHGLTLQDILTRLHARFGWGELGRLIQIRCFTHDPSMGSSLAFLRRQPWARRKVEELFLRTLEDDAEDAANAAGAESGASDADEV